MAQQTLNDVTVADAYLALLADRGIDWFFGNAGTDFAPLIESFAKARHLGTPTPRPILVPHENLAIHMALGAYMATGRPQVCMVHVNVGTANAMTGIINAARGRLPVLFSSGRTPYAEYGERHGRRNREVHWPQEMYDQGALTREFTKWDYELRNADVLETAVDRALNMAMSEPRGPVYLTLPREPLAEHLDTFSFASPTRRVTPLPAHPDPDAIAALADRIAAAELPLLITQDAGADPGALAPLAALAERFAIPVVQRKPRYFNLATDHPMHLGFDSDLLLEAADVVIAVDCDVPWIPSVKAPRPDATLVHLGSDPLFHDYPLRGYPCDTAIVGATSAAFRLLDAALATRVATAGPRIDARRRRLAALREEQADKRRAMVEEHKDDAPLHPAWIARCLDEVLDDDSTLLTESAFPLGQVARRTPGSYYSGGAGGGLGYVLGTALGVKLAAPERFVVSTVGDGAYLYGNPIPAHYVANAEKLPTLTLIMNNEAWGAVERNTRAMYPDGYAARDGGDALTYFVPGTAYEKAAEISGGFGERVDDPAALPAALRRAVDAVRGEGRSAVLNIKVR